MYKCRACLIKCEEDQISCMDLDDKLPAISTNISIADALIEIARVCIMGDPNQPTKICSSCCYRLQDAYIFIKRVQESASIIQQCSSIGLPPSITYKVPLTNDTAASNDHPYTEWGDQQQEAEINTDNGTAKDCLEDVRIANIQSCTDVPIEFQPTGEPPSNGVEMLEEAEIKKEPELYIEDTSCDVPEFYNEHTPQSSKDDVQNKNCRVDKMIQTNGHIQTDYMNDGLMECACRQFYRVDDVPDDIKQSIRSRFANMNNQARSLYIRSLLHACRCGRNNTKHSSSANHKTSPITDRNGIAIIYTLEHNGACVSIDRKVFIEVFGLTEKKSPMLNVENTMNSSNISRSIENKKERTKPTVENNGSLPSCEASDTEEPKHNTDKTQSQQCMLCSKMYKNMASLRRHVIVHHSYTTDNVKESETEMETYENGNELLQEIKKVKMKRKVKSTVLQCSICNRKLCMSLAGLKSHEKFCSKRMQSLIIPPTV